MTMPAPTPGLSAFAPSRHGLRPAIPILLCLLLALTACSSDSGQGTGTKKVAAAPVTLAVSQLQTMPVELAAIGTVEPYAAVAVRSQVTGTLEEVAFREGEPVKAGALLFQIDPRPFTARLQQAEAALAKDQAALENARRQVERYLPAAADGSISAEQLDQAQTTAAMLEATVAADQAAVQNARIDLDNCRIRAPIAGITGALQADAGNLVKAVDDTPLVTIHQVEPIKIRFTLNDRELPALQRHLAAGALTARSLPAGDDGTPVAGSVSFIDNGIDPATGTILLKADFPNREHRLWPGQFVDVTLELATRLDAVTIPARAVQTGQQGTYVFVVDSEQKAALRPVTVGFTHQDTAVIDTGLNAGETVVIDGQLRLAPGTPVKDLDADAGQSTP